MPASRGPHRFRKQRPGVPRLCAVLLLGILWTTGKPALAVIVPTVTIESISVLKDIPIYKDDIGVVNPPLIRNPVWTSTGTNEPFAYASTASGMMTVKFKSTVPPPGFGLVVTIQGDCQLGKFEKTGVKLPAKGGDFTVTQIPLPPFEAGKTNLYQPLTIKWSYKSGNKVVPIQTTTHTLYVTLRDRLSGTKVYLTTLVLAVAGGGADSDQAAFNKTWDKFSAGNGGPENVTNWNDEPLAYYPAGQNFGSCALDEQMLLRTGRGQCGSFAHLLIRSIAINGLASDFVTVSAKNSLAFMVKDWTFGKPSFPAAPKFKWKIVFVNCPIDMVPPQPNGVYGDLTSLDTLEGQNSAPPSEKVFGLHFIVKFTNGGATDCASDDCYFDPSYGVNYLNGDDFEKKAVDGYVKDFDDGCGEYRVEESSGLKNMRFNK